jgi:hypothetical protein
MYAMCLLIIAGVIKILFSEGRFHLAAIEVTFTIALDCAGRPRQTRASVPIQDLIDGEGKIAVGTCRDWSRLVGACRRLLSRLVVGHGIMITGPFHSRAGYPQGAIRRMRCP